MAGDGVAVMEKLKEAYGRIAVEMADHGNGKVQGRDDGMTVMGVVMMVVGRRGSAMRSLKVAALGGMKREESWQWAVAWEIGPESMMAATDEEGDGGSIGGVEGSSHGNNGEDGRQHGWAVASGAVRQRLLEHDFGKEGAGGAGGRSWAARWRRWPTTAWVKVGEEGEG